MKNHQFRPTGFIPFSKANGTSFHGNKANRGHGHECGRKKKYRGQGERSHNSLKK